MNNASNYDKSLRQADDFYQFVYVSRISLVGLLGINTLQDIAEISIKNNKKNHITGALCYGNGYFFQYVEGTEQDLTNLKNALLMDSRHQDMSILSFKRIENRRFKHWYMKSFILEKWIIDDTGLRPLMPFNPDKWQGDDWEHYLEQLSGYYQDEQVSEESLKTIHYNAFGVAVTRVFGEHQAFFVVQGFLVLLMICLAFVFLVK